MTARELAEAILKLPVEDQNRLVIFDYDGLYVEVMEISPEEDAKGNVHMILDGDPLE